MSEAKAGPGRPTKFNMKMLPQVRKLCELGATDREVAEFLGITLSTLYEWKHRYKQFSEALKAGKNCADERVVRSLYNRAVGYTFESEKVMQNGGEVVRAPILEHVPPDVTACIFWLKNRRRDEWRDRHELQHDGNLTLEQLVAQSGLPAK